MNERITLQDSVQDVFVKLSEGNPGAVMAMFQMFERAPTVDPQCAFTGVGPLLELDTLGIYGPRIWMLYKDVCKENVVDTLALLRAVQLGLLREEDLNTAIDNYGQGVDVAAVKEKVKAELKQFDREEGK